MNVWTTMQHSSEMILFIIFYFILRFDCHLAVSCGNPFAVVRFLWWALSLLCPTVKYHFWPDDNSSRFFLFFLSLFMNLEIVDTSRNRFPSLPKTLDVLENKSISEISSCTMYIIIKLWKLVIIMTMILRPSLEGNFVPHWNWKNMLGVDWCSRLKLLSE